MKRAVLVLLTALPLSVTLSFQACSRAETAQGEKLTQQVRDLRNVAAALVKQERFAQAADELEEVQVLCM